MVFRSKTDNGEIKKPHHQGSRVPLVITVVVLALVGGAYYFYYRKQSEYYTGRNLRLLSMLTAQVEGRVTMFADFVSVKANAAQSERSGSGPDYSTAGITYGDCSKDIDAVMPKAAPQRFPMRRAIEESAKGWKLQFQAYVDQKPPTCATIPIDDVVRPIFARNLGAAFDVLLIAKDDGTVLYSIRPPPASSTLLGNKEEWIDEAEELPAIAPLKATAAGTATAGGGATSSATEKQSATTDRDSGPPVLVTNLKALQKRKGGWFSDSDAINPASLTAATGYMTVSLGGADYVLFTQPYTYSRELASVAGNKHNDWIVCGLVSASRFRDDVFAVSTSIALTAIAIMLLALCCWPYLRIALIHPSQALGITDVVLIVVCTIVGAAVITLALLDVFAYRGITQTADQQLEKFGDAVNRGFADNVHRAMDVLIKAESATRPEAERAFLRQTWTHK